MSPQFSPDAKPVAKKHPRWHDSSMYKTKAVQDCKEAVSQVVAPTGFSLAGQVVEEQSSENIKLLLHRGIDRTTVIVHPTALAWSPKHEAERLTDAATQKLLNGLLDGDDPIDLF
jgi:hypothetical protein